MAEDDLSRIKVFMRLRPMNKLETSRRSKDCIELHDNPKILTVDAPLQGEYDFSCDMVFDEYASQQEVYREAVAPVASKVMGGVNCSVIAYGQTGTGKTHTMLGEQLGAELNLRTSRREPQNAENVDLEKCEGMIPRVVEDVFDIIRRSPKSMEFTVRCSFVEIYLEKVFDLLRPSDDTLMISKDENDQLFVQGASELCCIEPRDVYALLARGVARRTQSATAQNEDSSRSHAVFTMRIDQLDRESGKFSSSSLKMVDLAGSEMGRSKSSKLSEDPVGTEGKMINQSLLCLSNMVRATLALQGEGRCSVGPERFAKSSKLAKLLQPCFGGNEHTTLLCTASPSSYSIGETINTIKFAQKVQKLRNCPKPMESMTLRTCQGQLHKSQKKVGNMTRFLKTLAREHKKLATSVTKDSSYQNSKIWSIVEQIVAETNADENVEFSLLVDNDDNAPPSVPQERQNDMEKELNEATAAREKAENAARDVMSEVTTLRSEREVMAREKHKADAELSNLKSEIRALTMRKVELEDALRTSQFRENEATTFLRQFRSFYLRLLKNKAAQGNGDTIEVMRKIPGVPELEDLIDIDTLMMASGLIEEDEVGQDSNSPDYAPTTEALKRSMHEADQAHGRETELIRGLRESDNGSIVNRREAATYTVYRQKLIQSPAGLLAIKKEKELERELAEMSAKCANLQNSVNAEKAMVEALSARQGALGKIKSGQEMIMLRQELERKTNDLQAIVWKMNELHLVNKTISEKVDSREQHVSYLEEHVADLQAKQKVMVVERQETERRLREEGQKLQSQLDGLSVNVWQLGEKNGSDAWRLLVPFTPIVEEISPDGERRLSLGDIIEDVDLPEMSDTATTAAQTETSDVASIMTGLERPEVSEASVQTNQVEILDPEEAARVRKKPILKDSEAQTIRSGNASGSEAAVQTDERRKSDRSIQTDIIETAPAKAATLAVGDRAKNVETAVAGVQTETAPSKLSFEVGTQTSDLPRVIAVGGKSVDTASLADSETNRQTSTYEANLEASLSSIGEKVSWKPPKAATSDRSKGKPSIERTYSEQGSEASLEPPGSLRVNELKDKFGKVGSVVSPDTQTTYGKLNSSGSSLRTPGQSASKAQSTPQSLPLASPKPAIPPRPPREAVTPKWKHPKAKESSSGKSSDPSMPEWMARRKEMGIKAGEDENESDSSDSDSSHSSELHTEQEKPEWMQRRDNDKRKPTAYPVTPFSPPASSKETFQRMSTAGSSGSISSMERKATTPPTSGSSQNAGQAEWMQKFKKIGMKGEESVVEASGTAKLQEDSPNPAKTSDHGSPQGKSESVSVSQAKAIFAAKAEARPKDQGPLKVSHAPVHDQKNEWMQKFQQIGQKGEEEVVMVDPTGEDYEFTEEDLEKMRKAEKKARKKEKKALKKAKKEAERQQHNFQNSLSSFQSHD